MKMGKMLNLVPKNSESSEGFGQVNRWNRGWGSGSGAHWPEQGHGNVRGWGSVPEGQSGQGGPAEVGVLSFFQCVQVKKFSAGYFI